MSDKAEKLAAAKRKFKEFQSRKQKKDILSGLTAIVRSDSLSTQTGSAHSPSPLSSSNGVDSDLGGVLGSTTHSRNSSVSVGDYVSDVLHEGHEGQDTAHPVYDASEEHRPNGTHTFQMGKSDIKTPHPSHVSTRLLRQFSQESESVASSPDLDDARMRKKNLVEFQSSKSSSAESEKTNATLSSDFQYGFQDRRRTDSVSTIYSSSDNQDRKLSYGVGDSFEHGDVLELEKRVEELAAMLNAERVRHSDTKSTLSKTETVVSELQSEVEVYRSKQNEAAKGTESHDAQLKTYTQTIEILVAEKTELERCLDTCRHELSTRNSQLEEQRAQAAASVRRVAELESELAQMQSIVSAIESRGLELRLRDAEFLAEELQNELTEARARLESKNAELRRSEEKYHEVESALSLATLRVQQLSNNDGAENCDNELKVLQDVNASLTTKVATLEQSLRVLELERDNAAAHYQSYVRSLNSELSSLKSRFEGLNCEKDHLVVREESLVQHVAELEKQLQVHQVKIDELNARSATQGQGTPVKQDDAATKERIAALEAEKEALEGKLRLLAEENERLVTEVASQESRLERLEAEQIDMSSLQVTLESDRVAASRAIQQNNELKTRLEELQDAFIKLSNEKLELTEKLQHEELVNKDYADRLQREESRCKDYEDRLAQVPNRIQTSQETSVSNREEISYDALAVEGITAVTRVDAISQTDMEIKSQMDVEAMTKLEEKFRRKMKELADLSDEKQRLEHLVTQLQSETETIGEYVALYQTQRGALQEKAKEKDEQVVKLAQDKENLRNKLAELTELIKNLISKQAPPVQVNLSNPPEAGVVNEEINAEQIMSLLSDIGTTSLNQPTTNFHPCPWCSGQLITV